MKAIILAAGKGERLAAVTREIPKPMIRLKGKPVLQYNIELCRKFGIMDLYVNTHHLGHMITDYFGDGNRLGVKIQYSYENELLGTAGAVRKIASEFWRLNPSDNSLPDHTEYSDVEPFFVLYGDNYSEYDLDKLRVQQFRTGSLASIAFHYREDVSTSGVAEFSSTGRILSFIEKPVPGCTSSHWVNAGIYLLKPAILKWIPRGFSDFARDIFPVLLNNNIPIYGTCETTPVKAFDTPEMYKANLD